MGVFRYLKIGDDEFFIFDDLLIMQKGENTIISHKEINDLKVVVEEHFKNKKIVYISNKINTYSIDTKACKESKEISNIIAVAVISDDKNLFKNTEVENNLGTKSFAVFSNLTEAIKWAHIIIDKENKKTSFINN